jgi:hypothetical protein
VTTVSALLHDESLNATLSWLLVGFLLIATVESVYSDEWLWAGLAATVVVVAILPVLYTGRKTAIAPWELFVLAVVPLVGRSFGLLTQIAVYLAIAALALLIAVEIDLFSSTEMTPTFAVAFVVMTTMAVAGVWTVLQWGSDVLLGTALLGDVNSVMWDLVVATGVGVGAGALFQGYFRRFGAGEDQLEMAGMEGGA